MRIKLDSGAKMPTKAHDQDAGYDLYAMEAKAVRSYESAVFDTGVHIEIPDGFAGILISKSGLNVKQNLTSTGLIDAGYTGSIRVKLYNHGDVDRWIKKGDKISQIIFVPVSHFYLEKVDDLGETERGNRGFGSSGR